jgi:small-conductance mechanosensitive channel
VVRGILRISRFERLSENAGTARLLNKAALPSSSELLSAFVFWVTWLGFFLLGISELGLGLQQHISHLFLYLPRILVAALIVLFGLAAASFFSRAALLAAVNSNWPSPRLISGAIRFALVVLALAMAFEQLGLAEQTIIAAFSILFGALMLGLAIAFGLGGQHLARRMLERRFSREHEREHEDELSPL